MDDDAYVARAEANAAWYLSIGSRATPVVHAALVDTLMGLPSNVRLFAKDSCVFVSTGATDGQCLSMECVARKDARFLIVVHDNAENLKRVIAHEIAHAVLEHPNDKSKSVQIAEAEAEKKIQQWEAEVGKRVEEWGS